jgi:hypothetical protein
MSRAVARRALKRISASVDDALAIVRGQKAPAAIHLGTTPAHNIYAVLGLPNAALMCRKAGVAVQIRQAMGEIGMCSQADFFGR